MCSRVASFSRPMAANSQKSLVEVRQTLIGPLFRFQALGYCRLFGRIGEKLFLQKGFEVSETVEIVYSGVITDYSFSVSRETGNTKFLYGGFVIPSAKILTELKLVEKFDKFAAV